MEFLLSKPRNRSNRQRVRSAAEVDKGRIMDPFPAVISETNIIELGKHDTHLRLSIVTRRD